MKIISKYRDFYDYLQGDSNYYDPNIVYVRNAISFNESEPFYDKKFTNFFYYKYGFDLFDKSKSIRRIFYLYFCGKCYELIVEGNTSTFKLIKSTKNINEEMNEPVILVDERSLYIVVPLLKEIGWTSFMDAHTTFTSISTWLSREKVIKDNRTNNERIISSGFDVRTSFRNIK